MGLATLALVLATVTANSTCFFYSYQPKIPEKLIRK
ncbi:MAG: cyclic lactone autoinducer peptide [Lachnospiraceae bacterium]|nr:cyclic lactone autoinducer peptide [Lachnospiraceae bacterium]